MPEQPKKCWCYVCDGRVPAGMDEEGGHALQLPEDQPADLPERSTERG